MAAVVNLYWLVFKSGIMRTIFLLGVNLVMFTRTTRRQHNGCNCGLILSYVRGISESVTEIKKKGLLTYSLLAEWTSRYVWIDFQQPVSNWVILLFQMYPFNPNWTKLLTCQSHNVLLSCKAHKYRLKRVKSHHRSSHIGHEIIHVQECAWAQQSHSVMASMFYLPW